MTKRKTVKVRIAVGDVLRDHWGQFKVIAVADGYVMARRPRCTPFVVSEDHWFELGTAEPKTIKGKVTAAKGGKE